MEQGGFRPATVGELRAVRAAEEAGAPFVLFRDGEGQQRLVRLDHDAARLIIGRRDDSDLAIGWDERVSRTHAELERLGREWAIADDGISRNGTFVNGERVVGRRRLVDGDLVRVGHTSMVFRSPAVGMTRPTRAPDEGEPPALSEGQRRVLAALCRPLATPGGRSSPATNDEIAGELFLTVDAVKGHLRQLFHKFGVDDLPQIQKRSELARLALQWGLVSARDRH